MSDQTFEHSLSRPLRIGTRGSDLAVWQAEHVQSRLRALGLASECRIIRTQGDRVTDLPLASLQGKGFFTKEIEEALLDGRVDLAVHSLKDLSTDMPEGLCLAALVGREDPSELLLAREEGWDAARAAEDDDLPLREGARVGTSAARRQAQLRDLRPDLEILDLRGNVPTRVRKLREGSYDAILLAGAGVKRLALDVHDLFTKRLPVDFFIPAPGQGMLALQCRNEHPFPELLSRLHCTAEAGAVEAERRLLSRLEGGCRLPFGVNVRRSGDAYRLVAFWKSERHDALRIDLAGHDPLALADRAFKMIRAAAERGAA